ncbi:MAG TPA: iron ABC transporter permease [Actinomycetes bacterium]|jgi:iron(III) transport system permease protein|nr:iron ABC transporter permease [Actinomycetes bacterium]
MTIATRQRARRTTRPATLSRRRLELKHVILGLATLLVAYLALVPVGTMLVASLRSAFLSGTASHWTVGHYIRTFTSAGFGRLVVNSSVYATATAAVCTCVGFGLAWLVSRTNTPAKAFAGAAALVPLIIPGILNTVAWALLLSPRTGPLNLALRAVHLPAFDVYSLPGMVFVQSIHVTPIAFLMGVAAFTSMDASLEEAALGSGAPPRSVFRKITLRLVRPAILSAALLMFVQTISTFEVPQLIGVPGHTFVFVSKIYDALQTFPPDYGSVGVIGVFVLCIAACGLWVSRWLTRGSAVETITGKGFRPAVTDLGRWRWLGLAVFVLFFLVAVVLPLAILLWSSLLPGYQPPSAKALHHITLSNYRRIWTAPSLARSVRNSIVTAVASGAIVTALSAVVAYIVVKTRMRARAVLDGLATVPIAVPSVVMGVGILYWYLVAPLPVHLYGTLVILVVAFVTISLPYGMRYLVPGMSQIKDELEEAATASGASWPQAFRRVLMPLLMPSLLAAFLYTMIVAFREISAAIFLYTAGSEVVSVTVFDLWSNGDYPVVAALGFLMVLFLALVAALVRRLGGRLGIGSH